jgi:uncharacterized radical SAM superfamily Fe-S cluster-containing enzyme
MEKNEGFNTKSLCPICLKKLSASIVTKENTSYLVKECPDHGTFETVLWRGGTPMEHWIRNKERANINHPVTKVDKGCPFDCGLCSEHRQYTCTALIEVTQNCNLQCEFCFANSLANKEKEPSLEEIRFQYESIVKISGLCNIQLSGGEPTIRNDLPEIIRMGHDMGFPFIQVNTNGIRMADDEKFVSALKEAGLNSVFLQFDGTNDNIYEELRGKALFDKKVKAIESCRKYKIGVVLVPTLVPGVNINNIGDIIKFGIKHTPTVRGVHFQPVSYFGRMPRKPQDTDRITLPEVMEEIGKQTDYMVSMESMKPPGCENALCSFHGNYIVEETGLRQVTKRSSCCGTIEKAAEGAIKAKAFVVRKWSNVDSNCDEKKEDSDWDKILKKIQKNSFSISAMAFQDAWNVNLERIKDCCIHVVTRNGRLIPFCMYNLTNQDGKSLYRT